LLVLCLPAPLFTFFRVGFCRFRLSSRLLGSRLCFSFSIGSSLAFLRDPLILLSFQSDEPRILSRLDGFASSRRDGFRSGLSRLIRFSLIESLLCFLERIGCVLIRSRPPRDADRILSFMKIQWC